MKSEVKYGIMTGVCMILLLIISVFIIHSPEKAAGIGWINYLLLFMGIYLSIRENRENDGGIITFGRAFGSGFRVTVIAAALSGAFQYILLKFIRHDLVQQAFDLIEEQLDKQNLPDDQAEMAGKMARMAAWPGGQALGTLIVLLIIGIIGALIIAAILKREEPREESSNI